MVDGLQDNFKKYDMNEESKNLEKFILEFGLKRGENGLEIYRMVEIPSNVILAEQFSKYFDGFSIGSNDLTQLTLGIDRDSSIISPLFDERNEAAKEMVASVIQKAKKAGIKNINDAEKLKFPLEKITSA